MGTGILLVCLGLLASCMPQAIDTPAPSTLIPYFTSTRSPIPVTGTLQTPVGLAAAETPLPTSTPMRYTVQQGDTISSIALKFGVSMDDIVAANPEISPNAMTVGEVINIPGNPGNPSGEATPTPASFTIQQIACYQTADQALWCFVLAHNDSPDFLENVSAQVSLVDANGAMLVSQRALLPLNILPPNTSLPLMVFFPPTIPATARPQVQILTAIRLLPGDERYLPATVNNTLVQVNSDGLSAHVTGQVLLPEDSPAASRVWVTGTAYDGSGQVTGVRRWEWEDALPAGGILPFEFLISSLGGEIERVEFAVEARP
jgi:LysM repeat protein